MHFLANPVSTMARFLAPKTSSLTLLLFIVAAL